MINKTIEVLIVDFEINSLKDVGYHSKWKITEENARNLILTDDLEIHIIEIPKLKKEKDNRNNKKYEEGWMLKFLFHCQQL